MKLNGRQLDSSKFHALAFWTSEDFGTESMKTFTKTNEKQKRLWANCVCAALNFLEGNDADE